MMSKKTSGRKGRRSRQPRMTSEDGRVISHPPSIPQLNIAHSVRMRYISGSSANQNVTFQNLLDTFLVASGATAVWDVFQAVRVRAVEVWTVPVVGNASTVEVQFLGNVAGQYGKPQVFTDTSMGVQPAHVRAVPARKSSLALWQQSSPDVAFNLMCPTGSVIDLELSFIGRFGVPLAAQNASAATSAGAFYVRGFDGLASASTKFTPVADAVA
jgi:hypothetical protein